MAPAATNKRIKSSTENNDGRDRISELPDEIIHQVLRRISSPAKAARTAVLSRRWRSVWSCYPAMQYRHSDFPRLTVEKTIKNFKKFVKASMERFSRHSQIRMETLDISLAGYSDDYISLVKQLLKFATERKVEEISLISTETKFAQIEINAPRLQNLLLSGVFSLQKMELRAPKLKHLEIDCLFFESDVLNAVISELPSLRTLAFAGFSTEKKLKLSIPRLEVFKLLGLPNALEEIELDAGPTLSRFFLRAYSPRDLRKCTINNASACRLEAHFTKLPNMYVQRSYLGSVKSFITRFRQFQTVTITNWNDKHNVTFNQKETSNPTSIDHLKYCTVLSNSKIDKQALLKALFRVCRPNHLTVIHRHKNSKRFFQGFVSLLRQSLSNKGGADESLMWLNGLKDVKIIARDVDVEIEEEEEIMRHTKYKTQNQLSLELTWDLFLTC
ncbi:F-box/FBD/LRR-repeat protein At1g78750 [Linum perenne]